MNIKVYYLDDEQDLCDNFLETFSSDTIKVTTFVDPELAMKAAEQDRPDIFFIDFRLPKITGDQVALKLDPSIPKFLVTGDITVATKYNFVKIISKPYEVHEINEAIEGLNLNKS